MGDRLARQCDPAIRSGNGEIRDLPERQARRQRAPDAGPPGRGLGRGIRQRPTGGGAGLAFHLPAFVIPGRREAASPESILPKLWLWIPGSLASLGPRNDWNRS